MPILPPCCVHGRRLARAYLRADKLPRCACRASPRYRLQVCWVEEGILLPKTPPIGESMGTAPQGFEITIRQPGRSNSERTAPSNYNAALEAPPVRATDPGVFTVSGQMTQWAAAISARNATPDRCWPGMEEEPLAGLYGPGRWASGV